MKKIVVVVTLFFISTFSFAEQISSPFLWKAEKDGNVAYLFGTHHIGFSLSDLPESLKSYIDSSKNFLTELATNVNMEDFVKKASLSNGRSLDEYLSQDSWNKLRQIMQNELPEEMLKTIRPWYVSGLLAAKESPFSPSQEAKSLDRELKQYAQNQGLEIIALEDGNLPTSIFEILVSAQDLESQIQEFSNDSIISRQAELLELYNCYKAGDLACIEANILQNVDEMERQLLLMRRNKDWVPLIEKFSKSGQSFVATGVGHMLGEGNLLLLLEERGFSITRVSF